MQLATNSFTKAIRQGRKQIGLWVSLGSNFAAEVVAGSGFDWVLLDMEHSPNDLQSVLAQLQVFAGTGTTALVRPDWCDPVKVKRLLDIGAQGLLFPMIGTVETAKAAVATTRYPPRGVRGVGGTTRANAFGRIGDYFQRIEDETTVIVQIESAAALQQAEAIAAVDGVHGLFFGPADIGADIGILGSPMDPQIWGLIRPVARNLSAAGTPVGTVVSDLEFALELLHEGFTFVACGSDLGLLAQSADRVLKSVRDRL